MIRNGLVLGACMLMLAGCGHIASRQTYPERYTLTAPASSSAVKSTSSGGTERNATLQVARIEVAPWLQGTEFFYRLDYRHDNRIAAYAQSDWVAEPARLLEPIIRTAIASDSVWRAVIGATDPAHAELGLHIRLDDFSQHFASPQQSGGVLDATATLVDNRNGNAVAQRHFHVQAAAPTPDAAGGVDALNQAAAQFTAELKQWLRTNEPVQ